MLILSRPDKFAAATAVAVALAGETADKEVTVEISTRDVEGENEEDADTAPTALVDKTVKTVDET